MARNLTQLSASNLKELRKGDTVSVVYKDSLDGVAQVIASNFPKRIATTFSSKWADELPLINKARIGVELPKPTTSIVVIGGSKSIWQLILSWMIACCDGSGLRQFETFAHDDKPFSKCHTLRRYAHEIGCKYLEDHLQSRLNKIGSQQIHSEDVRKLYLTLPRDSDDLRYLAKHVAYHIFNNTLKSKASYRTLREEIPAFDEDVNTVLNPMVEERKAAKQAEREARAEANRQRKLESFHKCQWDDRAQDVKVDEADTVHTKVTLPQVRQGHNGRPAQYRLDLAQVVDKQDFSRVPYRGAKSQHLLANGETQTIKPAQVKHDKRASKGEQKHPDVEAKTHKQKMKDQKNSDSSELPRKALTKSTETEVKTTRTNSSPEIGESEKDSKLVVTVQPRRTIVPGADSVSSSNKNARRRAKKRAAAITTKSSKTSSESGTQNSTLEKPKSWADEMSKDGRVST